MCDAREDQYDGSLSSNIPTNIQSYDFKRWEMNYLEAAIFLEEGENNDKFDSHPRNHNALPAYMITHNHWFYTLDLLAAAVLLLLALIERPSLSFFENIPVGIHSSIELFALVILGISSGLQLRWLGVKTFVRHKRSFGKSLLWLIMVLEAFSVLLRNTNHFRVTRALRPVFLVDNRYCGGVRRFLRQILQSVPPILEVLGLLLFTLLIFVVFGFYLFSSNERDPFFSSFHAAFVSLYVLLTTANFPDVMMPSYANNRWSALFFIAYLAIVLYFIMNLMLAIVFVEFSIIEKDKFRKLLLHKREACQNAFQLLISHFNPNRISYAHFEGLMHFYKPKASKKNVYLLFKVLNGSSSGSLSLKEFYGFYDALDYRWFLSKGNERPWFEDLCSPFKEVCYHILRLVESKLFKGFVYSVIIVSGVIIVVRTILISTSNSREDPWDLRITWDQLICIAFYVLEIILKLIAYGASNYFSSGWNLFDFSVTLTAIGGVVAEYFDASFFFILILRPLRLLQLFKVRRRYRDIFETLAILLPRIASTVIVVVIIYYFFAIIGMELFSDYDMKDCCVNTTVEQYYKVRNNTLYSDYYYLNNFDTLLISGVTLFELTVVNNWFIIMEGYASVAGEWSRLYFMIFYLVMMVVVSIVVAFVIEAFTFRRGYNDTFRHSSSSEDEDVKTYVMLTRDELNFIYRNETNVSSLQVYADGLNQRGDVRYDGYRRRTKFLLQRRMYNDLITNWLKELPEYSYRLSTLPSIPSQETSRSYQFSVEDDDPLILSSDDTNLSQTFEPTESQSRYDDTLSLMDNPFFPSSIQPPLSLSVS